MTSIDAQAAGNVPATSQDKPAGDARAAGSGASDVPTPIRLRPRRWLGLIFWAAMVGFLSWLWPHSQSTTDMFMFFSRSSNVSGVMSHRGNLMFAVTTIELNPEFALTTKWWDAPAEGEGGGDFWFHGAYTNASVYKPWFGFGYSEGRKGDFPMLKDASWSALVIPHWALLGFCSLALVWHIWRFVLRSRERRWMKRGCCLNCGYDLQGIESDRCPECGASTAGALKPAKTEPAAAMTPA